MSKLIDRERGQLQSRRTTSSVRSNSLRYARLSFDSSSLHRRLDKVLHARLGGSVRERLALRDLSGPHGLDGEDAGNVGSGLGEEGFGIVEVAFQEEDAAQRQERLGRGRGGRSGEAEDG